MNQHTRRTVPALAVAVAVATALGASSLLLVAASDHGSAPARAPASTTSPATSDCKPPPASCGSESTDELVIHAANEAARRMIELQTHGHHHGHEPGAVTLARARPDTSAALTSTHPAPA